MDNGGSWWTRFLAVAGVTGATLATSYVASPTGAAAATALQVDAGYAGTFVTGQPVPVRVRVTADRLLAGELEVSAGGPPVAVSVEVPGGSEKTFLVVAPTSSRSGPLVVSARLPDGSKAPPVATAQITPVADEEVVGLLPGALAGRPVPGPAPLSVDVGTARFVAVGPAELDGAPGSLLALKTLGIGADELGRQAASVRTGILQWVEAGGHLLVDASPGTPVAGLPERWQPGAGSRAWAGAGEVRLTGGAMAAGRWPGLVEPTARRGDAEFFGIGGPGLGDALARDAGFRLPHLTWLVAFLAFYVAVVGPGLFVVLRRRRRPELAWAIIPLVAVVFTGASYAGGRGLRDDTQMVHGTVLATGSAGSTAFTYLGVSSHSGSTLRVTYPAGWLAGGGASARLNPSALTQVRITPGGVEGRLPLDAGQFGVIAAQGPSGAPGAIEVTATSGADGEAHGTVRNGTELHLDGAAVFMGSSAVAVGPLGPGEQQEWSLQAIGGIGRGAEFQVFGPPERNGEPDWTNLALLEAAEQSGAVNRDPGQAVAVGWTEDYRPPVRVQGRTSSLRGHTLVAGMAPVTASGARAFDVAIRRDTVRSVRGTPSVFRFTLPGGRTPADGMLKVQTPFFPLEVWTGDAWSALTCQPPGCQAQPGDLRPVLDCKPGVPCATPPRPPFIASGPVAGPFSTGNSEVALPAGAVRNGVVYTRFPNGAPFAPDGEVQVLLRESA